MSGRKEFVEEIIEVCKKHGYSISHEDSTGLFLIEEYSEVNSRWLRESLNVAKEIEEWRNGGKK